MQPTEAHVVESIRPIDLDAEIRAARAQAAVVRSLLDELDDTLPPSGTGQLRGIFAAQAIEEIALLGHKLLTLSALMTTDKA